MLAGLVFLVFWFFWDLWSIRVAPVRGGTHFLCRGKESKQRKPLTPPVLCVISGKFAVVAPEHPARRALRVSDKAIALPVSHFVLAGTVLPQTSGLQRVSCFGDVTWLF
ncbi:hypothetical protein PQQ51_27120 [Paraburkholderia xenovorans]|uniref:hypothetical protein n=1 Tax=Paraburkholderia xenovorans TaxID=36873 RepID=UPI0038B7C913